MDFETEDDWVVTSTATNQHQPLGMNGTAYKKHTPTPVFDDPRPASSPPLRKNSPTAPMKFSRRKQKTSTPNVPERPASVPAKMSFSYRASSPASNSKSSLSKGKKYAGRSLQFIADPTMYVAQLISTYQSASGLVYCKEETPHLFVSQHLLENLDQCDDPCTWVQSLLLELARIVHRRKKHQPDLTPKFQRLLVQGICRGLDLYLKTHQDAQPTAVEPEIEDLITFPETHVESSSAIVDMAALHTEFDLIDLSDEPMSAPTALPNDTAPGNVALSTATPLASGSCLLDDFFAPLSNSINGSHHPTNDTTVSVTHTLADAPLPAPSLLPTSLRVSSSFLSMFDPARSTVVSTPPSLQPEPEPMSMPAPAPAPAPTSTPQPSSPQLQSALTDAHKVAFINMIQSMSSPSIVYYAMDVFDVESLLCKGAKYEQDGTLLCQQLLYHGFFSECISCIQRFDLFANFPLSSLAEYLFNAGQGGLLNTYVHDKISMQHGLLNYINIQLRYNFAGSLGVIEPEKLKDVDKEMAAAPPLANMRERRYQKELVNCSTKVLEQLCLPPDKFYFIWLSQRYGALRWVISSRSAQQMIENDYSISSSSNYNGLLELVVGASAPMAKLAIKELVDIKDMTGATYFAEHFGQLPFLSHYQSLSPAQRNLGIIKGEQISHARFPSTKQKKAHPGSMSGPVYQLPAGIPWMMVDDEPSLVTMKHALRKSAYVGLDTEWVPYVAQADAAHTSVMQIATLDAVFLLDLKTLTLPANAEAMLLTEHILTSLFEAPHIVKLAYEFGGDLTLLADSLPSVKRWQIANFKDFKKLRHFDNNQLGTTIAGGLAGAVSTCLHMSMNKKQQISNWEKRPLTEEQAIYAACDAYCLLDIYEHLLKQQHPFVSDPNTFVSPFEERTFA
ncbi:hypothetical protein DM01DRAFT_1403358 [Hesseltinella vesiculosa]|uniref:3'-5' exonuclease domain-containing protein n=1 Tax=Hesseltinella vesiculosa TaxID=101127 RepID=A0A1X2GXX3_9FUNG|nr:hypothetical protein DM01DRAFT_1403358 [Hesseltinella vesiculosa]